MSLEDMIAQWHHDRYYYSVARFEYVPVGVGGQVTGKTKIMEDAYMHKVVVEYAQLATVAKTYGDLGLDVPLFVTDGLVQLKKEIDRLTEDTLAARLREAEARLEAIKTAEEKRGGLREEIARLKAKLGKA